MLLTTATAESSTVLVDRVTWTEKSKFWKSS